MNEIEELGKLEQASLPPPRTMLFDDLTHNVLKNLYLELGSGPVLYLLSPSYSVLNPTPTPAVRDFLTKKEAFLDYLREEIVQNLAVYTVILEANSYFIEQNDFLVLARLRERETEGRKYEIKFYTHSPKELLSHYEDKIYIGRDFLDLYTTERKHFGLKNAILSLQSQYDRLVERAQTRLKNHQDYRSFFQEIQESVHEVQTESLLILQALPPHLDFAKLSGKDLIDINAQYRAINHYLVELRDEVEEFDNVLRFKKETEFVRYVTKYKKDLTNLIGFFNIKVNGVLVQRIFHCKGKFSA
ncbi:MAG: hypothetical protein OEW05_10135 [Candidatus Aminicenantes bacterium]|nr:hypothetical protein [Candidatus Aminicenantes bacterium]